MEYEKDEHGNIKQDLYGNPIEKKSELRAYWEGTYGEGWRDLGKSAGWIGLILLGVAVLGVCIQQAAQHG